ncbi:MAG TPA: BatD family protein [Bacteroidales bacterium]|nr:BatD family protein [Bacteroidales bacterium]
MNRILKIMFVLALMIPVFGILNGQDIEFSAATKNNVQVGEQFRAVYTVNSKVDRFNGPDFEGFNVLSGPNSSQNQSYQFINGKVSQSFQITYTYYLQATREGTFTIPAASISIGNQTFQSNPLTINVSQSASGQAPPAQGNVRQANRNTGTPGNNEIFIKASVDKAKPFQGEQVIITYKIYTAVPVSQINITKISSFPGFWSKNLLGDDEQLKQTTEYINGKEYVVAELRKLALFAQRSGELKIEPMEMECLAQVIVESQRTRDPFFDSFFNDPFFSRNYQNVEIKLESNPLTIDVTPLPASGKPLDFSGAVGSFTLSSEIDRNELKTNEALNLKVTITGKGNLELIEALPLTFPPDFEVYDPRISNNLSKSTTGVSGSRVFEYLLIPRNPGEFQIRPAGFSYFDPSRQSYATLTTPAYGIKVLKGDNEPSGVVYSGVSQKNIQFIGSDIRHIKTGQIPLHPVNSFLISSTALLLWLVVPALLFTAGLIFWARYKKQQGDIALVRNRKATKVARKNLKKAGEYLEAQNTEAFFEEVSRAMWGYISNKFNIPLSDLSIESVSQRLAGKKVSSENILMFTEVLENCEFARFAPGDKPGRMQEIYNSALNVISRIEQELK